MATPVSATSAKNRFGKILRIAETEPVYIVKHGTPRTTEAPPGSGWPTHHNSFELETSDK
jgi:hypothetical protein